MSAMSQPLGSMGSGQMRAAKRQRSAARPKAKPQITRARGSIVTTTAVPRVLSLKWGRGPFPPKMNTVMTYSETNILTSTLGVNANYTVRMNGPYDPNQTGTGGQPRYWDTLLGAQNTNAPYGRYCVRSAQIECWFALTTPAASSGTGQALVYLFPKGSGQTDPTTYKELMERAEAVSTLITNQGQLGKLRLNTKVTDWTDLKFGDVELWGNYNTTPTTQTYFTFGITPLDAATSVTASVNWTITYNMQLAQYNDVVDS